AMLVTCWGLYQIDSNDNSIFVQNCKSRDFDACEPFIIKGRSAIDQTGQFELSHPPGFAGQLSDHKNQGGRPEMADKESKRAKAHELRKQGLSVREIAAEIGVGKSTVADWFAQ